MPFSSAGWLNVPRRTTPVAVSDRGPDTSIQSQLPMQTCVYPLDLRKTSSTCLHMRAHMQRRLCTSKCLLMHMWTPFVFFTLFLLTIKIRLRNKPEIDRSRPLIFLMSCHVSFPPVLSLTPKQDDGTFFQKLLSSLEEPPLAFIAL